MNIVEREEGACAQCNCFGVFETLVVHQRSGSFVGLCRKCRALAGFHAEQLATRYDDEQPFHWRVWFNGKADPVAITTKVEVPLHAVATACDMLRIPAGESLAVRRVERLDRHGGIVKAWDYPAARRSSQ